jgi:hypothetical protein
MKISSGSAPLSRTFALRSRYSRPTASASREACGPPTGVENTIRDSDPGLSTKVKAPMRSFLTFTLPSVAAKGPQCEYSCVAVYSGILPGSLGGWCAGVEVVPPDLPVTKLNLQRDWCAFHESRG